MGKSNKRKMFPSKGTRILFNVYLLLSFIVLILVISMFLQQLILKLTYGDFLINNFLTVNFILPLFIFWTGYGFFLAWFWVKSEMRGLIFRMCRVFNEISAGNAVKLTFRRKDPFHEVAKAFNHMVKVIAPPVDTRKRLEKLLNDLDDENHAELEKILKDWSKN